MRDVRLMNEWFPMKEEEESESSAAVIESQVNVDFRCESDACLGITCPGTQFCFDMWRYYECRCVPFGFSSSGGLLHLIFYYLQV